MILPTSGEVYQFGRLISNLSSSKRSEHRSNKITMIFQDFRLFPGLSAIENIWLPLKLHNILLKKKLILTQNKIILPTTKIFHITKKIFQTIQKKF